MLVSLGNAHHAYFTVGKSLTKHRTYYIWKSLVLSYDETWFAYPLWICAAVEVDLAVICACAPALRPFLVIYLRPLITSVSGSGNHSKYGKGGNGKKAGYTSTPSKDVSQMWSSLDEEKSSGTYVSLNQIPAPKKTLSKAERHQSDKPPERLTILRRRSIEISHQDRADFEHHDDQVGLAISTPIEEYKKDIDKWRPRDRPEFTADPSSHSSPSTTLPVGQHSPISGADSGFTSEKRKSRPGRNRSSTVGASPSYNSAEVDNQTFWYSDNSTNSQESLPKRNIMRLAPEIQPDGSRRWDIGQIMPSKSDEHPLHWGKETERGIEMKGVSRTQSQTVRGSAKEVM